MLTFLQVEIAEYSFGYFISNNAKINSWHRIFLCNYIKITLTVLRRSYFIRKMLLDKSRLYAKRSKSTISSGAMNKFNIPTENKAKKSK